MRIDLNLPKGDRQQEFLDQLNAELRKRSSGYMGTSGRASEGEWESTVTGPFSFGNESIQLTWRIVKSSEGVLRFVECEHIDEGTHSADWESEARKVISEVLAATLAERKERFFRRALFSYIGTQLDGEYWLPGMRFAPAWPEDDQPYLVNAERFVAMDMNIDAIDIVHSIALAEEIALRQAARLSLLLNIGLTRNSLALRWVIPISPEGLPMPSVRWQSGFSAIGPQLISMPKKGEVCELGKYQGSLALLPSTAGWLLSLPPQARRILRYIDNAEPSIRESFDGGARLHRVASVIGTQFPSVGLAYQVAAVEAISKADPTCSGFSSFIRKYSTVGPELDQLLNYMYGTVRSGHFHTGEFPLGEYGSQRYFEPLMDVESSQKSNTHHWCRLVIREAIVEWMSGLLPAGEQDNSAIDGTIGEI